jgi:hypothetical protein
MYSRQIAEETETSPTRSGDQGDFITRRQICAKLSGISVNGRGADRKLDRFPPSVIDISDRRHCEVRDIRYLPAPRADAGGGLSNVVDQAGFFEHGIRV